MAPSRSRKKAAPAPTHTPLSSRDVSAALGSIYLDDDELERLTESLAHKHRSVLRLRRDVDADSLPIHAEPVDWYPLARRAADNVRKPSRLLSYFAGDYYLQDAGSLLALAACGAHDRLLGDGSNREGLLICDLCAAPGGKATALLEAVQENGFLLANEPIRSRVPSLAYNLARCGSDRYAISSLDPETLADRIGAVFDLVLVDAPCSGQALVAKGRQSTSSLSPRQIEHSAARQTRILDAAMRLLRESGRLIYSTCTFAPAENETQISRLVDFHDFEPKPVSSLNAYASELLPACYRLWPHLHDCAGSFAASLEATAEGHVPRRWKGRKSERPPVDLSDWFEFPAPPRLQTLDSILLGWPMNAPAWVEEIASGGPELAHRTGQTWKPSHGAALRRGVSKITKESIEVDGPAAIDFLRGNPIPTDRSGWQVVCLEGRPLGWAKGTSGTGKNQLFPAARVRGPIEA